MTKYELEYEREISVQLLILFCCWFLCLSSCFLLIVLLSWRIAKKKEEREGDTERETYGYKVPESAAWSCQGRAGWMTKHKTRETARKKKSGTNWLCINMSMCACVCVWRSGKGKYSTAAAKSSLTKHKPKKRKTRTKKQEERKKHMARVWILMNEGNANRLTICDGQRRRRGRGRIGKAIMYKNTYVHMYISGDGKRERESTHTCFLCLKKNWLHKSWQYFSFGFAVFGWLFGVFFSFG